MTQRWSFQWSELVEYVEHIDLEDAPTVEDAKTEFIYRINNFELDRASPLERTLSDAAVIRGPDGFVDDTWEPTEWVSEEEIKEARRKKVVKENPKHVRRGLTYRDAADLNKHTCIVPGCSTHVGCRTLCSVHQIAMNDTDMPTAYLADDGSWGFLVRKTKYVFSYGLPCALNAAETVVATFFMPALILATTVCWKTVHMLAALHEKTNREDQDV